MEGIKQKASLLVDTLNQELIDSPGRVASLKQEGDKVRFECVDGRYNQSMDIAHIPDCFGGGMGLIYIIIINQINKGEVDLNELTQEGFEKLILEASDEYGIYKAMHDPGKDCHCGACKGLSDVSVLGALLDGEQDINKLSQMIATDNAREDLLDIDPIRLPGDHQEQAVVIIAKGKGIVGNHNGLSVFTHNGDEVAEQFKGDQTLTDLYYKFAFEIMRLLAVGLPVISFDGEEYKTHGYVHTNGSIKEFSE